MTDPEKNQLDRIEILLLEQIKQQERLGAVLLGVPGTNDFGIVGRVNEVCGKHEKLARNYWILVSSLIGSGIIGGSIWGAFG